MYSFVSLFSDVYYKHESDPLFIGDKENGYKGFTVFKLLKFLSSFINLATIQSLCSHTVFDFDFQQEGRQAKIVYGCASDRLKAKGHVSL